LTQLQALRDATLQPLRVACATARLDIDNPYADTRTARLTAFLTPGHSVVRFGVPRGTPKAGPQVLAATLTEETFAPFADAAARAVSGELLSGVIAPPCALGTGP
jgi:hypothetical protein